jgi:hypothetical protein
VHVVELGGLLLCIAECCVATALQPLSLWHIVRFVFLSLLSPLPAAVSQLCVLEVQACNGLLTPPTAPAAAAAGSFLSKLPAAALQLCVLQLQACNGLLTPPSAPAAAAAAGSFLSKLPAAALQLCVLQLQACTGLLTNPTAAAAAAVGSFLSKLPAAAPQLRVLDLSDCRGLPGAAIAGLLQQLHSLSRVKLDGIPEVRG